MINLITNRCIFFCLNGSYYQVSVLIFLPQVILLPARLNTLQEPARQQLQQACTVHSNVQAKYLFAAMLHQEALKIAQLYEEQAMEAFNELQKLTSQVGDCMGLAMEHAQPSIPNVSLPLSGNILFYCSLVTLVNQASSRDKWHLA
jgi:hypothetical protein